MKSQDNPEPNEILFQTKSGVKGVIGWCWVRGVRVVPSVDILPGHWHCGIEEVAHTGVHQVVIQSVGVFGLLQPPVIEAIKEPKARGEVQDNNKNSN